MKMTRLHSQGSRLVLDTKTYPNWPRPGTPEWDSLDITVESRSGNSVNVDLSGDGVLTFTAHPGDEFYIEFGSHLAFKIPRTVLQRSRSMRLKDKNKQRTKSRLAQESRKKNRT